MRCFIGIDLGSTTTKAVVMDENRNVLGRGITNSRSNYDTAAAIAKQAYREGRPVLDVARELTGLPEKTLRALLDPAALARGGIHGKPGGGAG